MSAKTNIMSTKVAAKNHSEGAHTWKKGAEDGKRFRSRRSIADAAYAMAASQLLFSEAASDIDGIELICSE